MHNIWPIFEIEGVNVRRKKFILKIFLIAEQDNTSKNGINFINKMCCLTSLLKVLQSSEI